LSIRHQPEGPNEDLVRPALKDGEGVRRLLSLQDDGGSTDFDLILPDREGAYRTLIGARHRHSIASNRDPQCGFANPTEGVTERELSRYFTVHPDVVDHQAQPMEISTSNDGRPLRWMPDYWCLFRDGTLEIGEVKIDQRQIDEDYRRKIARMADIVDGRLGCRFRLRYRKDIIGGVDRQHNVGMLHVDRSTQIEPFHVERLARLEGIDGLVFGDVVDELEPERPHRARGVARRLICMGRVWTDIDVLITEDSPVVVRAPADVSSPLRRHH
jgi:hypothetical protein